jgi:hypothetical protein
LVGISICWSIMAFRFVLWFWFHEGVQYDGKETAA